MLCRGECHDTWQINFSMSSDGCLLYPFTLFFTFSFTTMLYVGDRQARLMYIYDM